MKTITTKLYSFAELSPEAKETVTRNAMNREPEDNGTSGEILESMKALAEACRLKITDYSFGSYCPGWKFQVSGYHDGDTGPRALALVLRALLAHGYERPKRFADMKFPGTCGFTGVGFDDDMAETVWKSLLSGESIRKSFDGMAYRACQILEDEAIYMTSREYIAENMDIDEEIYTESGEVF